MNSTAKVSKLLELELERDQVIECLKACVKLMAENTVNCGSISSPQLMSTIAMSMAKQLDSIQEESDPVAALKFDRKFKILIPLGLNWFIKNLTYEISFLAYDPDNIHHVGALTDLLNMATSQLQTIDE